MTVGKKYLDNIFKFNLVSNRLGLKSNIKGMINTKTCKELFNVNNKKMKDKKIKILPFLIIVLFSEMLQIINNKKISINDLKRNTIALEVPESEKRWLCLKLSPPNLMKKL